MKVNFCWILGSDCTSCHTKQSKIKGLENELGMIQKTLTKGKSMKIRLCLLDPEIEQLQTEGEILLANNSIKYLGE